MSKLLKLALLVGFVGIIAHFVRKADVLNGLSSNHDHGPYELQAIVSLFCLSPVIGKLLKDNNDEVQPTGGDFDFATDGDIENEDYAQSSIYAILYGMYKNAGNLTSPHGVQYQFTFNTWGFAPSRYPETDPQRHGKEAYEMLVTQSPAIAYAEKVHAEGRQLEILEIGCGTGAGANHITRQVWPKSKYLALDMQAAAINTCNELHATLDNPGLTCQLVPNGVGNGGNKAPRPDSSVDFVVISETHIADIKIGDLEKEIFSEIRRVLKPGGLFLWGNALPTRVWDEAAAYLPSAGFSLVSSTNHTHGAVVARDEDAPRVDAVIEQLLGQYPVMKAPYFGKRCSLVSERLIANFYRHPGTALYKKMVTGYDSYLHQAWRNDK